MRRRSSSLFVCLLACLLAGAPPLPETSHCSSLSSPNDHFGSGLRVSHHPNAVGSSWSISHLGSRDHVFSEFGGGGVQTSRLRLVQPPPASAWGGNVLASWGDLAEDFSYTLCEVQTPTKRIRAVIILQAHHAGLGEQRPGSSLLLRCHK
ncbi:uncharacterized protein B0I36DRAFT_352151 [Microdochium trichocladiopsis]|uniref:Uncharacterized protein n=1 Tax=Microdochium trichocladiopsis TaxID=1682393 RepID=A0A9P9BMU9_9PEZI|nr:uncharacterized protein B0I36DRAFT_352151 [Microdochium trichocladiopsis]KAH7026261.1 hypothetical protein B0I36DRAFT_352151 [Microdochium trichocladiopsis]